MNVTQTNIKQSTYVLFLQGWSFERFFTTTCGNYRQVDFIEVILYFSIKRNFQNQLTAELRRMISGNSIKLSRYKI
jgi:hypothetical protein